MAKGLSVAVIGGGITGLTAALILARNGHNVTLIEKSPHLGMTMRGFTREDVYFDTGLHYTGGLDKDGIVSRYLRYLGVDAPAAIAFNEDGFDEIRFADTGAAIRLPIGHKAMIEKLLEHFPAEEQCIKDYIQAAQADFGGSSLLNVFLGSQGASHARESISLNDFLRKLTDNRHLCAVLSIHSLLYGVSPKEVPFTQHAYIAASYFDSAHNFKGGGRALILTMERRLRDLGVTVACNKAVSRLICDDGNQLTHLELEDGARLAVDAAVSTVHPATLADMGEDVFRPAYLDHLRELEETISGHMLFGIADHKPECLRGKNLFLCDNAELDNAFSSHADPGKGPFYVSSNPQGTDEEGKTGVVVVAPGHFNSVRAWQDSRIGKRPEDYKRYKEDALRRIREAVVKLCPELACVRFVDGATPLTMRDYLRTPHGSLYGAKHTVDRRNPIPLTRIPNLWLAGQSVIAPGLMGTMFSAFLACGFLLGHNTLHGEVACS